MTRSRRTTAVLWGWVLFGAVVLVIGPCTTPPPRPVEPTPEIATFVPVAVIETATPTAVVVPSVLATKTPISPITIHIATSTPKPTPIVGVTVTQIVIVPTLELTSTPERPSVLPRAGGG